MIFAGAETSEFEENARLTAMWLWTLSNTGDGTEATGEEEESDRVDAESGGGTAKAKVKGLVLEYDAARKIAQGVAERTRTLFGKAEGQVPMARRKK